MFQEIGNGRFDVAAFAQFAFFPSSSFIMTGKWAKRGALKPSRANIST
jgi:hypothetical protein